MRSLTYLFRGQTEPYTQRIELNRTILFSVVHAIEQQSSASHSSHSSASKSKQSSSSTAVTTARPVSNTATTVHHPSSSSASSSSSLLSSHPPHSPTNSFAFNAVSSRPSVAASTLYYPDASTVNLLLQTVNQCIAFESGYQDVYRGCGLIDLLVFHFQHLNEHLVNARLQTSSSTAADAIAASPKPRHLPPPPELSLSPASSSSQPHTDEPPIFLDDDTFILALKCLQILIDSNGTNLRVTHTHARYSRPDMYDPMCCLIG